MSVSAGLVCQIQKSIKVVESERGEALTSADVTVRAQHRAKRGCGVTQMGIVENEEWTLWKWGCRRDHKSKIRVDQDCEQYMVCVCDTTVTAIKCNNSKSSFTHPSTLTCI